LNKTKGDKVLKFGTTLLRLHGFQNSE